MDPAEFNFDLPPELIAQQALPERTASRLLHVGAVAPDRGCDDLPGADLHFRDLPGLLRPGDLLVGNDTRVLPARLHGQKATGGKVELLLERVLGETDALVQLRSSHAPKPGSVLRFGPAVTAEVTGRQDEFFVLRFSRPVVPVLEEFGHVPLPPYIRRDDEPGDRQRYQTVFAREQGSVAAPTAGLHFDDVLLAAIAARGVEFRTLTLHVGAGTFAPLRPRQLRTGRLHAERLEVTAELCAAVAACRTRGGRVIAVGTTATRALETAGESGELRPFRGETTLFIRPGYRFQVVDAMVTNFHLPGSSLLMLVCAFGGTERVLAAYRHAVAQRYRFFSYGDAMFLERAAGAPTGVTASGENRVRESRAGGGHAGRRSCGEP
ncbi:MAG: tRNA preQ1(34) S-adenosylmethionine ribosyltransferase-isomerase QueA [Chromatiales bacterium]|nr:tRNA preQ1(34) S-adenosylmethionine ribosyltransferase-isomerase QueA [Chromatiales bacterium]